MKATFGNCKPKLKVSVDFSDSSQYYIAYMYEHAYIRLHTPLSTKNNSNKSCNKINSWTF